MTSLIFSTLIWGTTLFLSPENLLDQRLCLEGSAFACYLAGRGDLGQFHPDPFTASVVAIILREQPGFPWTPTIVAYRHFFDRLDPLTDRSSHFEKVAKFYQQGCEGGHALSCHALATHFQEWLQYDSAAAVYSFLCRQGEIGACRHQGNAEEMSGNLSLAHALRLRSCLVFEDGAACAELDGMKYARLACEFGHGRSCPKVAYYSLNPKKKQYYYKKGCKIGEPMSCTFLGDSALQAKKFRLAESYFERGCDLGFEPACESLWSLRPKGTLGKFRFRLSRTN